VVHSKLCKRRGGPSERYPFRIVYSLSSFSRAYGIVIVKAANNNDIDTVTRRGTTRLDTAV